MRARGHRHRRGLSMIEVMIGIAVLAFVLLAFLSVIQSSATLSASSKQASIAAFQLQAALEATFALPFEDFKQIYNPANLPGNPPLLADPDDPDHPPGHPTGWAGHLGSKANGTLASSVPDLCQTFKSAGNNFTWKPGGWVKDDDLPLLNQHMMIEWVSQDPDSAIDWIEYRLTLTWTNHKGATQSESITTRRSR
ncbi:MAG TPA: prepilin-type N-terminal cleavage/methylation domain-containing protein [Planctomycetota bacterium]